MLGSAWIIEVSWQAYRSEALWEVCLVLVGTYYAIDGGAARRSIQSPHKDTTRGQCTAMVETDKPARLAAVAALSLSLSLSFCSGSLAAVCNSEAVPCPPALRLCLTGFVPSFSASAASSAPAGSLAGRYASTRGGEGGTAL
jgi:hypothetical protein